MKTKTLQNVLERVEAWPPDAQDAWAEMALDAAETTYWEQVVARFTKTDEWREDLRKSHWEDHYLNSADTRKFFDAEFDELKGVLTELGLTK